MSFVYKCNCEGAHGITGRRYVPTRKFIPTKVKNGDICVYCGHYAVSFAETSHPRSKGIGGYKPIATPRSLAALGYGYVHALQLNGINIWQTEHYFPWNYRSDERLEYYKEYYRKNKRRKNGLRR